jgi:hypothetical protein
MAEIQEIDNEGKKEWKGMEKQKQKQMKKHDWDVGINRSWLEKKEKKKIQKQKEVLKMADVLFIAIQKERS